LNKFVENFLSFRSPVQLNVFTYDENSFTEGKYKKVDEIPSVPLAPMTPMLCTYNHRLREGFKMGVYKKISKKIS
jgi:hypothetical protein